jgi:hypothetical protein
VIATLAHNLLCWIAAIGLGARQELVVAKTLRRTLLALPGRITRSARRLVLHLPVGWPWAAWFELALAPAALRRLRHLTHAAAQRTTPDPSRVSVSVPGRRPASRLQPTIASDQSTRPPDEASARRQASSDRPSRIQPVTNSGSVDSGLEEVRQLRAEGLSLPGDRRPGRLPLDPGRADPLRREAAAGVTSPTACWQCSADRTAGALEHGILDGSFQSGQAPQR